MFHGRFLVRPVLPEGLGPVRTVAVQVRFSSASKPVITNK
jgi:hypothetical protein